MRGEILDFDPTTGQGLISGDDGRRYRFQASGLVRAFDPAQGDRVDFVADDDRADQIVRLAAPTAAPADGPRTPASPWATPAATPPTPAASIPPAAAQPIAWRPLLFSFKGRVRRSRFVLAALLLTLTLTPLTFVPGLGLVALLAWIWPNLAVGWKRLQDLGLPGWLNLIPLVINVVGFLSASAVLGLALVELGLEPQDLEGLQPQELMETLPAQTLTTISWIAGGLLAVNLAVILFLALVDGQKGVNRYGPDPKGR